MVFFAEHLQPIADDALDVGLRRVDELAKGEVLRLNLVNTKVFHQFNVANDAGLDELRGIDVEGENALEVTGENQGTLIAVGVGVEFPKVIEMRRIDAKRFVVTFGQEAAEEGPGETVFFHAGHQPAHEVVIVAFRQYAHQAVVGTEEAVCGYLQATQHVTRDDSESFFGIFDNCLSIKYYLIYCR